MNITFNDKPVELKNLFVIYFFITFIYVLLEAIYFLIKNKTYKVKHDYYRELPRDYSPSMVSYLMNLKLEYKKDILSDLIFLEEKKIIKIDSNQNITIVSKDNTWKNYENHLKLLIDQIEKTNNPTINNLLNNIDLEFQAQYKDFVIDDLRVLDLIDNYSNNNLLKKMVTGFIFIGMILWALQSAFPYSLFMIRIMNVFLLLGVLLFYVVVFVLFIVNKILILYNCIIGKNFMRSKKGKEDVALWLSYERFIKDFSVMHSRNLEEKSLWGYYFAYALALGINKNVIKKFNLEYEKYIIK